MVSIKNKIAKENQFRNKLKIQKETVISTASLTVVGGKDKIPLLDQVADFYLSGFYARNELVGILDANPKGECDWSYHTISAGNQNISLVFLLEGQQAQGVLQNPYTEGKIKDLIDLHIKRNPVALLFSGRDDGHFAKAFPTVEKAKAFLETNPHFYDIANGQSFVDKEIKKLLLEYPLEEVETALDTYLFSVN